MRSILLMTAILLIGTSLILTMGSDRSAEPEYTTEFGLERCAGAFSRRLVPDGGNDYVSLKPGTFHRFEGEEDGEFVELEHTVLDQTRAVTFEVNGQLMVAITRVVEEREWVNGELSEVTLNYLARCPDTGNIFYFGEDVDIYEDGEVVSHEGTWLAGRNGARPGLLMPGLFLLGSRYAQELAPGVAMDRAEHLQMGLEIATPAGVFTDCVAVLETDPEEPDDETIKYYAPRVGLIADSAVLLVDFSR